MLAVLDDDPGVVCFDEDWEVFDVPVVSTAEDDEAFDELVGGRDVFEEEIVVTDVGEMEVLATLPEVKDAVLDAIEVSVVTVDDVVEVE